MEQKSENILDSILEEFPSHCESLEDFENKVDLLTKTNLLKQLLNNRENLRLIRTADWVAECANSMIDNIKNRSNGRIVKRSFAMPLAEVIEDRIVDGERVKNMASFTQIHQLVSNSLSHHHDKLMRVESENKSDFNNFIPESQRCTLFHDTPLESDINELKDGIKDILRSNIATQNWQLGLIKLCITASKAGIKAETVSEEDEIVESKRLSYAYYDLVSSAVKSISSEPDNFCEKISNVIEKYNTMLGLYESLNRNIFTASPENIKSEDIERLSDIAHIAFDMTNAMYYTICDVLIPKFRATVQSPEYSQLDSQKKQQHKM